jgi:hypothetical protein
MVLVSHFSMNTGLFLCLSKVGFINITEGLGARHPKVLWFLSGMFCQQAAVQLRSIPLGLPPYLGYIRKCFENPKFNRR